MWKQKRKRIEFRVNKIFRKKIKFFIFKNLFFFSSLRLRSVDQVYRVVYGAAADADHPQLTTPTCTTQTIAIHTSKGPVRSERVIATYLYMPALLDIFRIRQRNDLKFRPSVCHWANRKYPKNSTEWVCLYHRSLWQSCCCCCYRRPSGELCPTVVEAEAELVAVDCADWQTAPVETKQTRNETKNIFTFVETNSRFFFIISFGVNSLEKRQKKKKGKLFSLSCLLTN